MIHEKCNLCYNKKYRQDLCFNCEWLFKTEVDKNMLQDNYKPLINNERNEI